ncbi:MAG TPA: type II secretion system secretin GspD [Verrucomicrobiae bacterium]|nr:type II secretion system secretin GspD [Verrucomicrobiae bacterium]
MKRLISGLLLACAAPVWAATTLNLKDADINTLITTVSEVTGRNFIVDERVKGKVTVISSKPMSSEAVYETFLAVLAVKGYAAVPAGAIVKIVQDTNARQEGGTRLSNGEGRPDDDVVTHVYEIQNVSAAQLVPILRPLVPQWGHLVAYGPSNMLIISDRAANVVRLGKLIEQIDRTGEREVELVKLQHAGASDVVRILTTLGQQDKQTDPAVKPAMIIADERTNSVLLGGDKSERQKLLDLISQLDVPLADDGATQVVYLNYASAENLAPILEGYAQQADAANSKPGSAPAAAPSGGGGGFDGKTRIIADKDTNALVITGSPKSMKAVRNVIAQLDIKRSQVLVEAVIAEVSGSVSSKLGIDWAIFNPDRIALAGILDPSTLTAAAAFASGNPQAIAGSLSSLSGVVGGGGHIENDGKSGTSFAILLKALQGDGDTNVLSTPTIVATDNEESELSVGQEVPFLTGSFSNTGATNTSATGVVNPFQTIERKDVGLTLGITPQINEGDNIKLKLALEVSSLAASTGAASDLITNKRTLNTTVTVDNGQILVLGGLMDDNIQDAVTGIPFLSRLPLIGGLFQFRRLDKQKRNLMIFIRPVILKNNSEVDYYTRRKYDAVRQGQIDQINKPRSSLLPRGPTPVLQRYDDLQKDRPAPTTTPPAAPLPGANPIPPPANGDAQPAR